MAGEILMSLWYCPECGKDVRMLSPTGDGIDLSCGCKVYHLSHKHIVNNTLKAIEGIRKKTGWKAHSDKKWDKVIAAEDRVQKETEKRIRDAFAEAIGDIEDIAASFYKDEFGAEETIEAIESRIEKLREETK